MEVAATAAEAQTGDWTPLPHYSGRGAAPVPRLQLASLRASGRPLMVWPEDRIRPIRMTHTLPLLWVAAGAAPANGSAYWGEALRGEFFTFQIGAYAPQTSLALHVRWTELRGRRAGGVIGAARLRCINQPSGSAAARDGLHVAGGAVLPLWIGVDVPSDAPADSYRGAVLVSAAWAESGASEESVAVELVVGEDRAVEAGDGEPWRHSRLRWLDSTAGAEEEEAPEQPQPPEECDAGGDGCVQLQRREDAVVLIAPGQRQIALSAHGLPASLKAPLSSPSHPHFLFRHNCGCTPHSSSGQVGSAELLASPVELRLRDGKHDLKLLPLEPRLVAERGPGGSVSWRLLARAHSASATALHVRLSGSFANDGLAEMAAKLHVSRRLSPSGSSVNLSDVRLELPLLEAMVPLINGFDVKGGSRPAEVRWRWDKAQSTQDHAQRGLNCRVWLGSAAAGLQLNLQGGGEAAAAVASSCGNDEDGRLQCGDVSDAQFNAALGSREWYNSNRGGATVLLDTAGDHPPAVRLSVHTGELPPLRPGERLRLHWRLLLTPVRGAGGPVRADFATRYFHMQRHIDLGEALDTSPTRPWIILHQGNPLIPYINYPFIDLQPLRRYVRDAHAAGAKVKLYYTVRELSSRAVELWALRALGSEVLISSRGKAAGHTWLREHLRANYTAAWHEVLTDGEVDAAVQTPAFTSRWDNYWIEGILWLVRNIGIDGIYLDGAPYERTVLRRLRRALAAERRGRRGDPFLLDLHASCAGNPHLPYMELYPYLDSIWFGEQCEYRTFSPPMWLAEVSGVPFGLGSELLGDNSDQWQGLVHGMTCRIYPDPWKCNPRPLWAALDAMGMLRPRLLGWWDPACPVSLLAPTVEYGHGGGSGPAAVASVFIGDGAAGSPPRFAVAVANWADHPVEVRIRANYSALAALGLRSERKLRLRAREIDGFQSEAHWALGDAIRLEEKGGGVDQGLLLSIL